MSHHAWPVILFFVSVCSYYLAFSYSFLFFFLRQSFALVAQGGVQWLDLSSLQLSPPASASRVAEATGVHHHTWVIFCSFSRDGGWSQAFVLVIHPPQPPKVLGLQV